MKVVIQHDDNCPLGPAGLRMFDEAADALASTPPEARATSEDRLALALAWSQLQWKQRCNCGADEEIARRAREVEYVESSATPRE